MTPSLQIPASFPIDFDRGDHMTKDCCNHPNYAPMAKCWTHGCYGCYKKWDRIRTLILNVVNLALFSLRLLKFQPTWEHGFQIHHAAIERVTKRKKKKGSRRTVFFSWVSCNEKWVSQVTEPSLEIKCHVSVKQLKKHGEKPTPSFFNDFLGETSQYGTVHIPETLPILS